MGIYIRASLASSYFSHPLILMFLLQACIFTEEEAVTAANRIGYPVMLKASEGGGGKGIRMAKDEKALREAWPQVLGEVPGSPIFLVQLCTGARHLEVQVMADKHGNAIALGGRDCSTQRRFQKIFEEGPPTIAPDGIFTDMMSACSSSPRQPQRSVSYSPTSWLPVYRSCLSIVQYPWVPIGWHS